MNIWGQDLKTECLERDFIIYFQSLPVNMPSVEWLWQEMDRVWFDRGLDNKSKLSAQDIGGFYSHPVWIANGIFTSIDKESMNHRKAIKDYLVNIKAQNIADYGGGSGVLAAVITTNPDIDVDIVEPYPFSFFTSKYEDNDRIRYVTNFEHSHYDAIIAQDVLEHVEEPINMAYQIAKHVKQDGYIIFANCFYPVIECHLPSTFYLRHTFKLVMKAMGLKYIGQVEGASHALIFQKKNKLNLKNAILVSNIAKASQPLIKITSAIKHKLL